MKKESKGTTSQTTLVNWIAKDLSDKDDFVQYGQDLHKVLETYTSTQEIVRILSQHSPTFIQGVYAKTFDSNGKILKDVLITTNLDWKDDIISEGLVTKKEIIPKHERNLKWMKVRTPDGFREIRVPTKCENVEIHVVQQEPKDKVHNNKQTNLAMT